MAEKSKTKRGHVAHTIDDKELTCYIRQVRVRDFDEFAVLLSSKRGTETIGPGAQAHGFVKLFTDLKEEQIDELDHDSVGEIVRIGLEMNAGFFASYPEVLKGGLRGVETLLKKNQPSPSTTGSTPPLPQPDAESKSAET